MTWSRDDLDESEDFKASSHILPLSKSIAEAASPHGAMWAKTISGKTAPIKDGIYVLVFTEVRDGLHCQPSLPQVVIVTKSSYVLGLR